MMMDKTAAWVQGALTALKSAAGKESRVKKSAPPRPSMKMGLGTPELLPSMKSSTVSTMPRPNK